MVIKTKENFEKTRHVRNNDKSKKYILSGQRKSRYQEKILSNKKKSYNFVIISKKIINTELKFSTYTNFLTSCPIIYHTLF